MPSMLSHSSMHRRLAVAAARYPAETDAEVESIGAAAKGRGHLTRGEFLTICRWKTPRSRSRCETNSESLIEEATTIRLPALREERLRIGTLTLLKGVGWPTASVLLHLCHPDRYPILDFRALESLECPVPDVYEFEFWWDYTLFCRQLSDRWQHRTCVSWIGPFGSSRKTTPADSFSVTSELD